MSRTTRHPQRCSERRRAGRERLEDFAPAAEAAAAAWLREPGLLTERLRACCDGHTGPRDRRAGGSAARGRAMPSSSGLRAAPLSFVRSSSPAMAAPGCSRRRWCRRRRSPASNGSRRSAAPRSANGSPAMPGLARGPLEFARLGAGRPPLSARAARAAAIRRRSLWARRSWFAIDGDRLLVQEVFLPEVARMRDDLEEAPLPKRKADPRYKPSGNRRRCATLRSRSAVRCANTRCSCACTGRSASGCCCGRRCGGSGSRAMAGRMRGS